MQVMKAIWVGIGQRRGAGYLAAVLGLAAVIAVCAPWHDQLSPTTVALALVLVVLCIATLWGRGPGIVAAVLGMLGFNLFLPPLYALTIADPDKWVALAAFFITASTVGHLSVAVRRRAAEAEAGRQAARLASLYNRSLLEASLDPLVTIGPDGTITDVNAATELVTGRTRAELLGTDFADYCTEPEKAQAGYQQVFRDGFVRDYALELRHRDGHLTSVLYNASVYRDDRGTVRGVFAAARDITALRRVEEALRESETKLNRAQEVAHIGSWYLDIPHNRLTWSDEVFRIFGVPKDRALTYDAFLDTVHPEDRASVETAWTAALHGAPYDIEHRIVVDGALKWVRERAQVAFDTDGHAVEGIGTVQDVTERKRAEEALRETEKREEAQKRELEIGFKIQQMLLLNAPPRDVPGLRVAALTIPSQRIDGDFYDFFTHEHQCLDVIVADVMGKGIPAALLGAATKSQFLEALSHLIALSQPGQLPEPKDIVTLAHAEMVQQLITLESFVTLCYARLDLNEQRLTLVDCGHTGVIHFCATTGLCTMVHGTNLPLGIRAGEIYEQISVAFAPGDVLLFYSDGVTEARNSAGELFGAARLADCVRSHGARDPEALVEAIRQAVCTFAESNQLSDDLTCVAIKVEDRQMPLTRTELELRSDLTELRRARAFVRSVCNALPGTPLAAARVTELELAVNEATSNIIKHAYHGRTDQRIYLEAETFPDQVAIRLYHIGDPCDPSSVAPPALDGSQESGFGLYLIRQSVDDVRYYCDARGRHCIALVKRRRA
jgi:sigma-B regulation protein RsbU (phosphoserine phosphatase)